jgi:hypothetical protein
MRHQSLFVIIFALIPLFLFSQNEDCITAEVICSDGDISFTPTGSGINDFLDLDNDFGCLLSFENQSGWYYFEFQPDMPPNSVIEFVIIPDGGIGEDYDFAVYGPDVSCDSLGSPIRCSYADNTCIFCPQTGLGNGATDLSENLFGDGFVAPLVVQPGEGYYLLLDNWMGSSLGFNLSWSGDAAPYLNCDADPTCELALNAPTPLDICGGDPAFSMPVSISGNSGSEVFSWTATGSGISYLSSPNVLNPTVSIPPGFSGSVTYTLLVTEGECNDLIDITVNVSPMPMVDITGPQTICSIDDATLQATTGFSNYTWSNGGSGTSITVNQTGTYTVTITDGAGCQNEASFDLEVQPQPVLSASGPVELCAGDPAFSLPVSITGTNGTETYSWTSTGQGLDFISATDVLSPTVTIPEDFSGNLTYSLSVSQGICDDMIDVQVVVNGMPNVDITGPESVCEGDLATLSATPGFTAYQWSGGGNTANIDVSTTGTYSVTVSDGAGCENDASFDLQVWPLPTPAITGDPFICDGNPTELTVTPSYSDYLWSTGESSQSIPYTQSGQVTVLVTDANGCQADAEIIIEDINIPPPVIQGDNILCPNEVTTLFTVDFYAGYAWSNGSTDSQITVTNGDTYSVTVTDDNGCINESSFLVEQAPELFPEIIGDPDLCEGDVGTLILTEDYPTYSWNTGSSNPSIIVGPGTWAVTVTDLYNCSFSDEFVVTENPLPEPTIDGLTSFCLGSSTTLTVLENYSDYFWSNGDVGQSTLADQEAEYTVTVIDANGCIGESSIEVTELESLQPEISGTPEFCAGDFTMLVGANGYLTYQWSDGTETQEVMISSPGEITLYVTDVNGCDGSASITVIENPGPEPQIITEGYFCEGDSVLLELNEAYNLYAWSNMDTGTQTYVSQPGDYEVSVTDMNGCVGTAATTVELLPLPSPEIDGILQFCPETSTVLSGESGYTNYEWSDGTTDQDLTVLLAGEVTLTVVDSFGCIGSNSVTITEFPVATPSINGDLQFCPGTQTELSGEDGFVAYEWSNGTIGQTTMYDSIGTAILTVTDMNGCISSSSVTLSEFIVTPPVISGDTTFCSGQSIIIAGEPGYAVYEWENGSTNTDLLVSAGGIYELTVQDINGCHSSAAIDITENPLPEPEITGPLTFCVGSFTTLTADQDYETYNWSNGNTTPSIIVDMEGLVSLLVSDSNGCIDSTSAFINQETELAPVIFGTLEYCENDNTTLDAGGGYATYNWSNGMTSQAITVNSPGTYSLTVSDGGGCMGDTMVVIVENPLPAPQITGTLTFCQNDSTTLNAGGGYNTYSWSDGSSDQALTVDLPGNFTVTVTDTNNCSNTDMVTVTEMPLPDIAITGQTYFCEGDGTNLVVTPGFAVYQWSNGNSTSSFFAVNAGTYIVTVTDNNGCQSDTSTSITEIPLPVADAGPWQYLDCDTPEVILQSGNSTQGTGIIYNWTGPDIDVSNTNILSPVVSLPGSYHLIVTNDTYGCISAPSSMDVVDLSYDPAVNLEVTDTLDCLTTSVLLDATGSETGIPVVYEWFDGQGNSIPQASGLSLEVSEAQEYSIMVLDTATACSAMASVIVAENYEYPYTDAGTNQHLDCIVEETELNGSNSDQGNNIEFQWHSVQGNFLSGTTEVSAMVNAPGLYYLTVLNTSNGCHLTDSVMVTQDITQPFVDAGENQEIDCHSSSVVLVGNASAAGEQFEVSWTKGNNPEIIGNQLQLTVENAGTYTFHVTNLINGCENEDQVVVTQGSDAPAGVDLTPEPPTCAGIRMAMSSSMKFLVVKALSFSV